MVNIIESPKKESKHDYLDEYFKTEQEFFTEKTIRCDEFKLQTDIDTSFKTITTKEKTLIEYSKQFEKKIQNENINKNILLTIPNEYGTEKFICTFIKSTKLGYKDLFDYDGCARFLSNFIKYEMLENPTQAPCVAVSPYTTINWQAGDSLDMSIVLVSFLIGVGYDAYVVCGKASKEVTTKSEGNLDCPYIEDEETKRRKFISLKANFKKENEIYNEYFIDEPKEIKSKFDIEKQKQTEIEAQVHLKELEINDDEPERQPSDYLKGKRVHYWVLVRKSVNRDLDYPIFIDAATGNVWNIEKYNILPFYSIDQIFNDRNIWLNRKPNRSINKEIIQSFSDPANNDWISVLPEEENKAVIKKMDSQYDDISLQTRSNNKDSVDKVEMTVSDIKLKQLLDKPLSWVPRIDIDQETFYKKCKTGKYTKFYKKVEVDFYSDYNEHDGLIQRVTLFEDYARLIAKEIKQYYKNRADNLYLRRRFPFEFKTIDYYSHNTSLVTQHHPWPNWKEIEHVNAQRYIIRFYPIRFNDGLIEREEIIGEKTIERYIDRDDKLVYSSVRFVEKAQEDVKDIYSYKDRHIGNVLVIKMVQKFARDDNIPAHNQVKKIRIDMKRNKVRVWYHINSHEIAPVIYEVTRDDFTNVNTGFHSNAKTIDPETMKKNQKIYSMEKDCFSKIKFSELNVEEDFKTYRTNIQDKLNQIYAGMKNDQPSIKNDILVQDIFSINNRKMKHQNSNNKQDDDYTDEGDIVGQLLKEKGLYGKNLDVKTAGEIKREIVYNLQNRYIERSEIITQRFEEEKNKVKALQKKFQRKANEHITKEEEQEFEEELQQFNLKLSILEQRLFNFQKTAYEKYEKLQQKLENDPRLISESEDQLLKNNL